MNKLLVLLTFAAVGVVGTMGRNLLSDLETAVTKELEAREFKEKESIMELLLRELHAEDDEALQQREFNDQIDKQLEQRKFNEQIDKQLQEKQQVDEQLIDEDLQQISDNLQLIDEDLQQRELNELTKQLKQREFNEQIDKQLEQREFNKQIDEQLQEKQREFNEQIDEELQEKQREYNEALKREKLDEIAELITKIVAADKE